MKNARLKEKLNIYADSLERKDEILCGAFRLIDAKRKSGAYDKNNSRTKRRYGFSGLAAAAVVFIVVIGIILSSLPQSNNGDTPAASYSLSSLQKQSVSRDDFYGLNGVLFLEYDSGQSDGRFFVYVNNKNEVCAARAIYKVIRNGSVDEVTVLSDLKDNLSDYKANKPQKDGTIRDFDSYQNGEYYSYLASRTNSTTYYITIISPSPYAGEYYENILL